MPYYYYNRIHPTSITIAMLLKALISSSFMTSSTTTKAPLFFNKRAVLSSLSSSANNFGMNNSTTTDKYSSLNVIEKRGISNAEGTMIQELERSRNDNMTSMAFAAAVTAATTASLTKNEEISASSNLNNEKESEIPQIPEECLKYDHYNGVQINISSLASNIQTNPALFQSILSNALSLWANEGKRGIWVTINKENASLIPICIELGFTFQQVSKHEQNLILTKWLPETQSRLPLGPSHQIGVGALILHPKDRRKMLVVQERTGPAAARKLWKMPTGLTDPGEDASEAAIRELKEETGLDCVFDRIVCFRQAHGGLFNRSDMFFVCLCKLAPKYEEALREGKDIELFPQEEEILCADWIDMEDYAVQGLWIESPLYKEMNGAMLKVA